MQTDQHVKIGVFRIVSMASLFELFGDVPWGDLGGSRATDSSLFEYGNSKLMVIMAGREMNKRLRVRCTLVLKTPS